MANMQHEFTEYLGKRVRVTTQEWERTSPRLGKRVYTHCVLDENDTLIPEIQAKAEKMGYQFRLLLPTDCGTSDHNGRRLTVYVTEQDGVYLITRIGFG